MVTQKCGRYEAYDFKHKRLITNLWGLGQNEVISMDKNCIFVNSDDTYGWKWDRPNPKPQSGQTNIAPFAPSICVGTDPLGAFATTEYLPIRLRDIDSLILYANYIYSLMPSAEDSQNLSYDIWVTDSGDPKPSTPRKEIMVWLNRLNVPMPEDKRGDDVSDGYNTFKQYAWENYHAFILDVLPQPEKKTSTVDLKKIFEYLLDKGVLKGDQWLALIALENEVWKGKGEMTINQMDSQLNGTWISCPQVVYSQTLQ